MYTQPTEPQQLRTVIRAQLAVLYFGAGIKDDARREALLHPCIMSLPGLIADSMHFKMLSPRELDVASCLYYCENGDELQEYAERMLQLPGLEVPMSEMN